MASIIRAFTLKILKAQKLEDESEWKENLYFTGIFHLFCSFMVWVQT